VNQIIIHSSKKEARFSIIAYYLVSVLYLFMAKTVRGVCYIILNSADD